MECYDSIPTKFDYDVLNDLHDVLTIFKTATDMLQGSKYPTLNFTFLLYAEIKQSLENEKLDPKNSCLKNKMYNILLRNFGKRFKISEQLLLGAILDPITQNLTAVGDYIQENNIDIFHLIQTKCSFYGLVVKNHNFNGHQEPQSESTKNTAKKMKYNLLLKHVVQSPENILEDEYLKYKHLTINPEEHDVLDWWKVNYNIFPNLAALAKIILAIPATSAPSERNFSYAGILITNKRSQLAPTKVEKVLFIHDNFDNLKDSLK